MVEERTTVVNTGSSNVGLIILAIAIVIAAVVGFMYFQSEQTENSAVTGAATAVGEAAGDVSDAVKPDAK